MHSVSKYIRPSKPTTIIWMKTDPYYQQQRCSANSGNIRFMRIFAGVPWKGGVKRSNDSRVVERVDFQGFRTLRLRYLRKRGQHILLFSTLSPFHWPQNTWPWMTSNGHFTLNFLITNSPFRHYFYILTVELTCRIFLLYYVTCRDVRKWIAIRRIYGIRVMTADLSQTKGCGATSSKP